MGPVFLLVTTAVFPVTNAGALGSLHEPLDAMLPVIHGLPAVLVLARVQRLAGHGVRLEIGGLEPAAALLKLMEMVMDIQIIMQTSIIVNMITIL